MYVYIIMIVSYIIIIIIIHVYSILCLLGLPWACLSLLLLLIFCNPAILNPGNHHPSSKLKIEKNPKIIIITTK